MFTNWGGDIIENSEAKLRKAFSFTTEDLNANESGFLTPEQEKNISKQISFEGCMGRSAIIFSILMVVAIIAFFLRDSDLSSRGFRMALPYMLGTFSGFVMLFVLVTIIQKFRNRDIIARHISTAEGMAHLFVKKHELGEAFFVVIAGDVKFQLTTKEQMKALEENSFYRVYYIKHNPLHIILSIQKT